MALLRATSLMRRILPLLMLLTSATALAEDMPVKSLELGAAAPPFSLPGIDGKTYTLDSFQDAKVLALIFTCVHCPTAQAYEARVQQLFDDYKGKGAAIVAINPNDPLALRLDEMGYTEYGDTLEDMKARAKDAKITYPFLYDGDKQEAARAYGPAATPHVFIFDDERKLRYRGHIDDGERGDNVKSHDARNAIDALLAGRPVPVETTIALGCSTKWSEKRKVVAELFDRWAKEPVTLAEADAATLTKLLKNDTNKLRMINIFATWCPPCVAEFPDLVDIMRMYSTRDFEVVFLSMDVPEEKDRALAFLQKQHAATANYLVKEEDGNKLMQLIGSDWQGEIPFTLLIAPGGKVLRHEVGTVDLLRMKQAILKQLGRRM